MLFSSFWCMPSSAISITSVNKTLYCTLRPLTTPLRTPNAPTTHSLRTALVFRLQRTLTITSSWRTASKRCKREKSLVSYLQLAAFLVSLSRGGSPFTPPVNTRLPRPFLNWNIESPTDRQVMPLGPTPPTFTIESGNHQFYNVPS